MRIALVFGTDGADVRVGKTCHTLVHAGHEVHYVGWNRQQEAIPAPDLPGMSWHVLHYPLKTGKRTTLAGQIRFSWHVWKMLLKIRPDIVCAVNEDNVLRVAPLRSTAYGRLVCDVYDSHADRVSERAWFIRWPTNAATWLAWALSDRLVATDERRWENFGRHRQRTIVVGNYPLDPHIELNRCIPEGDIKVFLSGSLSRARGLDNVLQAVRTIDNARLVVAGWPSDAFAKESLKDPLVDYRGMVTPRESLEIGATCDAFLAFYEPSCRNHILASPNKVFDALSVGRPVIINDEALISQWVDRMGVGFTCPYGDVSQLRHIIVSLAEKRKTLDEFQERARNLFLGQYSWEAVEPRVLSLYQSLQTRAA